ncbi:M48 family metallopeptidase [Solimicrobium silvestre]|uniref:Putative metal-dependent hydrolase n=1 Tax=Solimicrobium silvestre TaxID=2099400 RepID=A0A2S9H1D4_9BURK|nr:SprT family zinc-dependent metalloprotease [Solimicrobium silvestre]PRC93760.1 putative metal-dependent hydrolase [Solimicrobium silvestre]
MAGSSFSPLSALAKFVQFDLFEPLARNLIEVAPQAELPKVLELHPHGVQLGTHYVPYQLIRSKRRSIGFLITDEGLRITAPRWVGLAEINAAILSKQRWVLTKLQEQQDRPKPQTEVETIWTDGATLPFLGQTATLRVQFGAATQFDSATGLITLNLPSDANPAQCKKHLLAWLTSQARRKFSERLPYFAEQLCVQYHSFTLTSANTRWGSCNSQGKIRLNWRLIHFSPHLIDYVIAHELAHLHEMNHSPRFWATVERVFPDYVAAREELKHLGMKALPQF